LVRLLGITPAALLLSGLLLIAVVPVVAAASGDWTQYHDGPTHQGYNSAETTLAPSTVSSLGVAWTATVAGPYVQGELGVGLYSSAAIANGVVYVGSTDGELYAFAVGCASGGGTCTPLWTGATGGLIESSPAVADGVVYVGSDDHKVYAFAVGCASGGGTCTPLWTGATGDIIRSSPAVADGVVYVGSADDQLYAFAVGCRSDGGDCAPLWTGTTGWVIFASPVVAGGVVYVGSIDDKLYAFAVGCRSDGGDCSPLWTATLGDRIEDSLSVVDGVVYVGSLDGKLYAFDAAGATRCAGTPKTCSPLWTGATGAAIWDAPAVANGVVYVGSGDNKLYAFAVGCGNGGGTCSPLWTGATGGFIESSPAVANGVVYVGSGDNKLYAFAVGCGSGGGTCSPLWSGPTGDSIVSSPAVANGVIYVGSLDGKLYAFGLPAATLPTAPTGVSALAGNASASVSWSAPSSDGGSAITGYTVTSSPDAKTCTWSSGPLSCTVSGLTNGQAYTFTVTATNGVGTGPASDPSNSITPIAPIAGATYHAISPTRILDTRNGTGGLSGPFTNHAARTFQVTGGSSGVPAGATAVTGNLTVTGQTSSGYLFIGPVATNNPASSTLNFPVGDDRANAVTVALGAGGTLSITFVAPSNGPTAQAIFDVTGYFTPDTSGATYHALSPTRVLDSRNGTGGLSGPFTNHAARTFTLSGVPAGATAVTGNLTVTGQTSSGYLFIGPVATNNPTSSTLNFPVGDDRANAVTVQLGAGGTLSITFVAPSNGPTAQAIFDVTGYFTADMTGATYVPLSPTRDLDTRNGTGGLSGPFTNHAARTFTVAGIPSTAVAVTGNLTVTGQTSSGYLFIGPAAANNPTSSTLNFPVGDDRANAVAVQLGTGGTLSITFVAPSNGPSAHAIFDVTGYFLPGS